MYFVEGKLGNLLEKSHLYILAWVIDIMWETLLPRPWCFILKDNRKYSKSAPNNIAAVNIRWVDLAKEYPCLH